MNWQDKEEQALQASASKGGGQGRGRGRGRGGNDGRYSNKKSEDLILKGEEKAMTTTTIIQHLTSQSQ